MDRGFRNDHLFGLGMIIFLDFFVELSTWMFTWVRTICVWAVCLCTVLELCLTWRC